MPKKLGGGCVPLRQASFSVSALHSQAGLFDRARSLSRCWLHYSIDRGKGFIKWASVYDACENEEVPLLRVRPPGRKFIEEVKECVLSCEQENGSGGVLGLGILCDNLGAPFAMALGQIKWNGGLFINACGVPSCNAKSGVAVQMEQDFRGGGFADSAALPILGL